MTVVREETFDQLDVPESFDETNTAYTLMGGSGGTSTVIDGVRQNAGRFYGNGGQTRYARTDLGAPGLTAFSWRFYIRVSGWPAPAGQISTFALAGWDVVANVARLRLNDAGQISMQNITTQVDLSSSVLAPETWNRVEWDWSNAVGTSTQECRLYLDTNMHGDVPNEVLTGAATGHAAEWFRIGIVTVAQSLTYDIDEDLLLDAVAPTGPVILDDHPLINGPVPPSSPAE